MKYILAFLINCLVLSSLANVPTGLYSSFLKKEFKVIPNEKLPQELRHIITSISQYKLTDNEKSQYMKSLILIDSYSNRLTKEELLFLGKSEILKSLFKGRTHLKPQKRSHNPKILLEIESWTKNTNLSEFTKWFLTALHSDLNAQFESPFFRQFMLMRIGNKRLTELELKKLEKRFNLLLPWYEEYKNKGPELFQQDLKTLLITTLSHVSQYYGLLSKYAYLSKKMQLLAFEKLTNIKIEVISKKASDKSVFTTLFPEVDPNYQAPEVLPKPVDSWMPLDDMKDFKAKIPDELFPKADPNYKAPEKLPEPVNDWLLNF
jgi:hypothetical protein